jgi:uncharacterized membrane protein YhaH (DUF805 family)
MFWYLKVIRNYVGFSGRAQRKEFWMFTLFNLLITIFLAYLDYLIFDLSLEETGPLGLIYSLAVLLPTLAVAVRRLHDIEKSGWYFLVVLIPLIGPIWMLIMECTDGDRGINIYGPDPKVIT